MITKENYEAYFLDFLEGRLSENQIEELNEFLNANPDLRKELEAYDESVRFHPDMSIVYRDKRALRKRKLFIPVFVKYSAVAAVALLLIMLSYQLIFIKTEKDGGKEFYTLETVEPKGKIQSIEPESLMEYNSIASTKKQSVKELNTEDMKKNMEEYLIKSVEPETDQVMYTDKLIEIIQKPEAPEVLLVNNLIRIESEEELFAETIEGKQKNRNRIPRLVLQKTADINGFEVALKR